MQHDLRFPSAKNFFTTLGWLSVIALIAVLVLNLLVYSTFNSFSDFHLHFNLHQPELIFAITFAIIAIVSIIMSLILKLFKHS